MTANRIASIALGLVTVLVLVAGWFLGVQPQLSAVSAADDQTASVRTENTQHELELATLKKQFSSLPALEEKLADLRASLPGSVDSAGLVDSIYATAAVVGVHVTAITPGEPSAYNGPSGTKAKTPTPTASSTPAPTPSGSSSTPPTPITATAAGTVAVDASDRSRVSTGNFLSVPVAITIDAGYGQLLDLLYALQSSTRLFLVTQATLPPGGGTGSATVSGLVYVLLDSSAPAAKTGAASAAGTQ